MDSHIKNVGYSVASFLAVFYAFKAANVSRDSGFWLVAILLPLVYFELWDISKGK